MTTNFCLFKFKNTILYSLVIRTVDNSGLDVSHIGSISTFTLLLFNVFLVPKTIIKSYFYWITT